MIADFEDGRSFVALHRMDSDDTPFMDVVDGVKKRWTVEQLVSFVAERFHNAYDAKRAEQARLIRNSCYKDGFHYDSGDLNRSVAIENHIHRIVETQVANTVAEMPRPEIVPDGAMSKDVADRLQEYATAIMNNSKFDAAIYLGARDKRIYGWNVWGLSSDYATGMPVAKPRSVFSFFPDPAGRDEEECQYFIFAEPVPTDLLRATYPDYAHDILPDQIGSPADDAILRPWEEFLETLDSGYTPPTIAEVAPTVHDEGTAAEGTASLVPHGGSNRQYGRTTYFVQMLLSDNALKSCTYLGTMTYPQGHPENEAGGQVEGMKMEGQVPRCPSGWWLISMTGAGKLVCDPEPVDECWMGLPFVVDRVEQRTDRFWSMSDVDQAIPMQRGINRRTRALDNALELSAEPPVLDISANLNQQLSSGYVSSGETLSLTRASDVRFLEFQGPSEKQFARAQQGKEAMQEVVGLHAALEGERPAGIEAASAIEKLDANASRRLRGGENPAHRNRAIMLRKMMYSAGKKLQPEIHFIASNGQPSMVRSYELLMPFHIGFAEGTGNPESRALMENKMMVLFEKGAIDLPALLDAFRVPDRVNIIKRVMQAQSAAAAAATEEGGKDEGDSEAA